MGCDRPGSASASLRAMRSVPSVLVRVTPSASRAKAAAQLAVSCAIPRRESGSLSARSSSASRIASGRRRLAAAGVADRLLAILVCPAGAVGNHIAVVRDEEVADDRLSACSWPGVGSMSPARRSWPSPRLLLVASA